MSEKISPIIELTIPKLQHQGSAQAKKEALKNPRMQNINGSSLAILISRYKREQSAVAGQRLKTSTTTTATWTSAARAFLALCFVYAQ